MASTSGTSYSKFYDRSPDQPVLYIMKDKVGKRKIMKIKSRQLLSTFEWWVTQSNNMPNMYIKYHK